MKRRRICGGVPHFTEVYGVPCKEPDKHEHLTQTQEWGVECWFVLFNGMKHCLGYDLPLTHRAMKMTKH